MRNKYSKDLLADAAASSKSMADMLRRLGLNDKAGGNYRFMWAKLRAYEISTAHFTGAAWSKGMKKPFTPRQSNEEVFSHNSQRCPNGPRLIKRLLALGWNYRCQFCGLDSWCGQPMTLHLDHINGINNDNRFENLRLLCPNCHQQTETWGNGLRRPKGKASAPINGEQRL